MTVNETLSRRRDVVLAGIAAAVALSLRTTLSSLSPLLVDYTLTGAYRGQVASTTALRAAGAASAGRTR
jgi:hypothetical protein